MDVLTEEYIYLLLNEVVDSIFRPNLNLNVVSPRTKANRECVDPEILPEIPTQAPMIVPIPNAASSSSVQSPLMKRRRLGVSSGAHEQILRLRYENNRLLLLIFYIFIFSNASEILWNS